MTNLIVLKVISGNIVNSNWFGRNLKDIQKQGLDKWASNVSNVIKKNKNKYEFFEEEIYVYNSIVIGAEGDLISAPGHTTISSKHCQINKTPWGWQLLDLKSTNGTYLVRNREITPITEPTFLKENDIIHLGKKGSIQLDILRIEGDYKNPNKTLARIDSDYEPNQNEIKVRKPSKVEDSDNPKGTTKNKQKKSLWERIKYFFWH